MCRSDVAPVCQEAPRALPAVHIVSARTWPPPQGVAAPGVPRGISLNTPVVCALSDLSIWKSRLSSHFSSLLYSGRFESCAFALLVTVCSGHVCAACCMNHAHVHVCAPSSKSKPYNMCYMQSSSKSKPLLLLVYSIEVCSSKKTATSHTTILKHTRTRQNKIFPDFRIAHSPLSHQSDTFLQSLPNPSPPPSPPPYLLRRVDVLGAGRL
jgi:hypothetical protein